MALVVVAAGSFCCFSQMGDVVYLLVLRWPISEVCPDCFSASFVYVTDVFWLVIHCDSHILIRWLWFLSLLEDFGN